MASARVIVATPHPQMAVTMRAVFEARGLQVTHRFDCQEALVHAEIVLADALVVQLDHPDVDLLLRCADRCPRVGVVIVSSATALQSPARRLGLPFVPQPYTIRELTAAVRQAIELTRARRSNQREPPLRSGTHRLHRMLIVAPGATEGAEIAAVMREQLGIRAEVVADLRQARRALEQPYDCVLAAPRCVLKDTTGAAFVRQLFQLGVPLLPLEFAGDESHVSAAQLAWRMVPMVREALDQVAERANASNAG